jgi:hypothetical protein
MNNQHHTMRKEGIVTTIPVEVKKIAVSLVIDASHLGRLRLQLPSQSSKPVIFTQGRPKKRVQARTTKRGRQLKSS